MRLAFRTRRQRLLWTGAAIFGTAALLLLRPKTTRVPEPPAMPAVAPPIVAPPRLIPTAPAPVAASTAGLQLTGVLGYAGSRGAAIFALPDGRQRLVAVGRDVTPGVRLESIAADRATVHDGVQRLEFVLPDLQATSTAAPVPVPAPTPAPAIPAPADPQPDLASFRAALKPEGDPARPRGYRIDGSAPLPALDRAGLRAGDIVLAVNGRPLDEARLRELPAELLGATSVEIEYERAGRRLRATVPTGG
jgi:hypothetical protein